MSSRSGMRGTIRALLRVVVPSVLLSEVGLVPVRLWVPVPVLRSINDVVGNYLQTLGTVYAVLLAFVVFVVWSQFNDARQLVEREANEALDLYRTSQPLPADHREPVHQALRAYVDHVLEVEWHAMARLDTEPCRHTRVLLDRVWAKLTEFAPSTDAQTVLYGELLARFNDLSDLRSARLTAACQRVPGPLRIFLYTGAAMTLGSMYLFGVDRWLFHALMTGAMAGMLSHVLYIIGDLDNCFAGDWQVPRLAFERVKEAMHA